MVMAAEQFDQSFLHDEALAERARLGHTWAFANLLTRHRDAVYVIVSNLCRTAGAVEAVLQEALLTAWREVRSIPAGGPFTTWLYRIVTRTALARSGDARRTNRPWPPEMFLPTFDAMGCLVPSDAGWAELEDGSPQQADIALFLREALQHIDDETRAAFVLCDLLQLRTEDAAAILMTSPQTVGRNAHRARLVLRGVIDGLWRWRGVR